MTTLDDAWAWYQSTKQQLRLMHRLARRYWEHLPWDEHLNKDQEFQVLQSKDVQDQTERSLAVLDDLAVVVLFSVFESLVRRQVSDEVTPELGALKHPVSQQAAKQVLEQIEEGSFFHVLEPYKPGLADLVEQVNQVRRYRNWVAHGKRGPRPDAVVPTIAYERLRSFATELGVS